MSLPRHVSRRVRAIAGPTRPTRCWLPRCARILKLGTLRFEPAEGATGRADACLPRCARILKPGTYGSLEPLAPDAAASVTPGARNQYAAPMRNSRVFAIVLAGGEGKRLAPLTADRAKPAVPFGGNYRLIDFALSNLVNAGPAPDRGADAVQEREPRPAHRDHVAAVAAARQLRHAGARPDAPRPALVRGLGRRDLPEPEPDLRRAPAATSASSAPTTSTAWIRARCSSSTSRSAPASRWPASASRSRAPREFGVIETDGDSRTIRAFREKPKDPVGDAGRARRRCSPRWATTSSRPTC